MTARYCAYPMVALALAVGSAQLHAQENTPSPPPPVPHGVRPSFGIGRPVPQGGQWVWQQSIYGGGGGYWAFIKPQDFSNYYGEPDGGQ